MIKVYKRATAPAELATKGYKCDEVKAAILEDQHDKCYLCERKVTTDYQVEHLASQKNNADKINDWENLFMACNYCNDRKKHYYDDIPLPSSQIFEEEIVQAVSKDSKKATFTPRDINNQSMVKLSVLLDKLYNGKKRTRNLMESRFWKEFFELYTAFMKRLADYQLDPSPDNKHLVEEELDHSAPILGFKYSVIKSNPNLWNTFSDCCKWS